MRTLSGHSHGVMSVAFSPDGTRVVSGSDDMLVKIWDVETGAEVRSFVGGRWGSWVDGLICGGFAYPGVQCFDDKVHFWQMCTLKGNLWAVVSVAFSPDGTRVVSGSHDTLVKIWDAATGAEVTSSVGVR